MWLRLKTFLTHAFVQPYRKALPLLVLISACGFQPLYGDQNAADAQWLASVEVQQDKDRLNQILAISIEDAINPKGLKVAPQFRLEPLVQTQEYPFATNLDGSVSRFVIDMKSSYKLIRLVDGKVVDSGNLHRTTSYNVSDTDDYATFIADQDAQERAMEELAELYRFKLRSYFGRYAQKAGRS